jgi:hypothetical protein
MGLAQGNKKMSDKIGGLIFFVIGVWVLIFNKAFTEHLERGMQWGTGFRSKLGLRIMVVIVGASWAILGFLVFLFGL